MKPNIEKVNIDPFNEKWIDVRLDSRLLEPSLSAALTESITNKATSFLGLESYVRKHNILPVLLFPDMICFRADSIPDELAAFVLAQRILGNWEEITNGIIPAAPASCGDSVPVQPNGGIE